MGSFKTAANPTITKGAGVTVACPESCAFTVTLAISAKTARKYGLGRKALTIGKASGSLLAAGSKKVTVKLSAKPRRKLRRVKKLAATLRVSLEDAQGKSAVKTKALTLKP